MQIVIDIPEEYYKAIMEIPVNQATADMLIIKNGTPLPKGHGDLIDVNRKITVPIYDPQYDEWEEKTFTVREALNKWADEGVTAKDIIIPADEEGKNKGLSIWLGKNCKDCGNEKCKKLGTLPKKYDCALWQSQAENYSIKMVTNAEEAKKYPVSKDDSKDFEELTKMISKHEQAKSEEKNNDR